MGIVNKYKVNELAKDFGMQTREIIDILGKYFDTPKKSGQNLDEKELESKLFAIIACRAAIKAGDEIDRWSAEALLKKVFELDEPACPHGRTFLIKLSEKDLRMMVGRTQ